MSKKTLKLFVWDVYAQDYTSGLAVAIAHDSDEARVLIEEKQGYRAVELANEPMIYELHEPIAFAVCGGG